MDYLWAFYFVSLIYISVFVPVPYCLDDCGFVIEPEGSRLIPLVPFFFLKIALAIQGFLYFHTNCETICSSIILAGHILTECGLLEKGMANHFSILALRAP